MRSIRIAAIAVALCLTGAAGAEVISIGAAVAAQAATDGTVDLGPLASAAIEIVAPIAITALSGLLTWVLARIGKRAGLEIEEKHSAALKGALEWGVRHAADAFDDRAKRGIPVPVKSQAIEAAADYVLESVPDALRHFGYDRERVKRMVGTRMTGWLVDVVGATPDDWRGPATRAAGG